MLLGFVGFFLLGAIFERGLRTFWIKKFIVFSNHFMMNWKFKKNQMERETLHTFSENCIQGSVMMSQVHLLYMCSTISTFPYPGNDYVLFSTCLFLFRHICFIIFIHFFCPTIVVNALFSVVFIFILHFLFTYMIGTYLMLKLF